MNKTGPPATELIPGDDLLYLLGVGDSVAGRIRNGQAKRSGSRRSAYIAEEIRLLNYLSLQRQRCWGPGWMEGILSFEESLAPFKFCTMFLT